MCWGVGACPKASLVELFGDVNSTSTPKERSISTLYESKGVVPQVMAWTTSPRRGWNPGSRGGKPCCVGAGMPPLRCIRKPVAGD